MSEDKVTELAQVVVELVHKVNLLQAKLDVALELLAQARLTGEPDNQDLIAERLAAVEASARTDFVRAAFGAGAGAAAAPVAPAVMGMGGAPVVPVTADIDEPTAAGRAIETIETATVTERVVETIVHPDGRREVIERVITHDPQELRGALESARRQGTAGAALGVLDQLGKGK